jgi:branched-chain amino acid transport system ATP-binding protein
MSALLQLEGVAASYGASQVLFDVSLAIGEGEVVALLGRNGMGKTTTVRAVMGLVPARGAITFDGRALAP